MYIEIGDSIKIKPNLSEVLVKYGFEETEIQSFCERFENTEQVAHDVYFDSDNNTNTYWVTVDLCCEIPLECCEKNG